MKQKIFNGFIRQLEKHNLLIGMKPSFCTTLPKKRDDKSIYFSEIGPPEKTLFIAEDINFYIHNQSLVLNLKSDIRNRPYQTKSSSDGSKFSLKFGGVEYSFKVRSAKLKGDEYFMDLSIPLQKEEALSDKEEKLLIFKRIIKFLDGCHFPPNMESSAKFNMLNSGAPKIDVKPDELTLEIFQGREGSNNIKLASRDIMLEENLGDNSLKIFFGEFDRAETAKHPDKEFTCKLYYQNIVIWFVFPEGVLQHVVETNCGSIEMNYSSVM